MVNVKKNSPFKMYTLLFYLLISVSHSHLQSSTLTEATASSRGFTFDLIHRYSPKSPFYSSSMTNQERYQSLALHSSSRHRHLKRLESSDFETDLVPSNGDYLIKISLGVPPVDLFVIADTNSDLIWVKCKPCSDCNMQSNEMFDPNQSTSFETIPCDSQYCPHIPQTQCDTFTNICQYWYTYGNGSSLTSGFMAKDIFTFGSVNSSFIFGCSLQEDEDFNSGAAGFIGLSGGRFSLISQLGVSNQFSYCLTPSNSTFTSKLRLGSHVVTGQGAVTATLLQRYLPSFYVISLRGISIGQRRLDVDRDIFVDTGSTLTYIDPTVCSSLEQAVQEAVGIQPMAKPPQPELSLCYDRNSGFNPGPAHMVFHFDGGEISLRGTNIFVDLGDVFCLAIVPSQEDGDPMILGNMAQVNFEVEYDLDSKTMSFTPMDCAHRNIGD